MSTGGGTCKHDINKQVGIWSNLQDLFGELSITFFTSLIVTSKSEILKKSMGESALLLSLRLRIYIIPDGLNFVDKEVTEILGKISSRFA